MLAVRYMWQDMRLSSVKSCIVLYLFSVQNIHEKDTEHCQHSVHTDNNKVIYITCKVRNIIIKTARLHNSGLKYVVTYKVYKLNPS
jgi:hypothetical protein